MTATRSGAALPTSEMTSLIRLAVPSSTPFIRETRTASEGSSGAHWERFSRSVWEGTVRTANSASRAATAGSVVARTESGRRTPGR